MKLDSHSKSEENVIPEKIARLETQKNTAKYTLGATRKKQL
jgi:hypothetical protein